MRIIVLEKLELRGVREKFLEMEENIESRASTEGEDDVDIFQTMKVRI